MLKTTINLIFILSCISFTFCAERAQSPSAIILCTAAIIPQKYNSRKAEYINVLEILKKQTLPFFVVESCLEAGPTFLDDYCKNVLYAHSNNPQLRNKGVNEANAILHALKYFNFDDDAIIIKLTGRYPFNNLNFIELILNNPSYDAFIKYDASGQVYTGCFAMRCKYLKDMLLHLNLQKMEHEMINIEMEAAYYLKNKIPKSSVYQVSSLGITARFFGTGDHIEILEL